MTLARRLPFATKLVGAVRAVVQPHFVLRPQQLVRRLALAVRRGPMGEFTDTTLPWGLPIRCRPDEGIGESIAKRGVFEPHVSEVLWRLLDRGEVAIDAGANIGYMTSLMLQRVGQGGTVIAIEPHPDVRQELVHNVATWRQAGFGPVIVISEALSDRDGDGVLGISRYFALNRGIARLVDDAAEWSAVARYDIVLVTLDTLLRSVLQPHRQIGVLKVDVEYSEVAVFRGAAGALTDRRVRDIVYEDHGGPESEAAKLLRGFGYKIFRLGRSFSGVVYADTLQPGDARASSPDYLATLDPRRASERLRPHGWRIFRG